MYFIISHCIWIIYSRVAFCNIYVFSDNPKIPSELVDNPIVYLANLFFLFQQRRDISIIILNNLTFHCDRALPFANIRFVHATNVMTAG